MPKFVRLFEDFDSQEADDLRDINLMPPQYYVYTITGLTDGGWTTGKYGIEGKLVDRLSYEDNTHPQIPRDNGMEEISVIADDDKMVLPNGDIQFFWRVSIKFLSALKEPQVLAIVLPLLKGKLEEDTIKITSVKV